MSSRSLRDHLLRRRTLLLPTWKGWLLLLLVTGVGATLAVRSWPGFLTVHRPCGGQVLVLEGWLTDDLLEDVVREFRDGGYRRLVTTGGPLAHGSYLREYGTYAELSRRSLEAMGLEPEKLEAVPAPRVVRGRTLASVRALRDWLERHPEIESLDVITLGAHARRTLLVYERILGETHRVGVFALEDPRFEGRPWWRTSSGVRSIIGETIAYLYGLLFSLD